MDMWLVYYLIPGVSLALYAAARRSRGPRSRPHPAAIRRSLAIVFYMVALWPLLAAKLLRVRLAQAGTPAESRADLWPLAIYPQTDDLAKSG